MRQIAQVPQPTPDAVRLMIHDCEAGVCLFGFDTLEDSKGRWDQWLESVAAAEKVARDEYGVAAADWQTIPDPLEHCQQDWIAPVRVKGRIDGQPQFGHFETLINHEWVDFHPEQF